MPPLADRMLRIRFVWGVVFAGLGIVASVAGVQGLVDNFGGPNAVHSPSLILLGLFGPAVLSALAIACFRLAYRNLFWRRYVASVRSTRASQSTTAPHEP